MNDIVITIKGPSQSGKSEIANQIARMLTNQGAVTLLDGIEVRTEGGYGGPVQSIGAARGSYVPAFANTRITLREAKG